MERNIKMSVLRILVYITGIALMLTKCLQVPMMNNGNIEVQYFNYISLAVVLTYGKFIFPMVVLIGISVALVIEVMTLIKSSYRLLNIQDHVVMMTLIAQGITVNGLKEVYGAKVGVLYAIMITVTLAMVLRLVQLYKEDILKEKAVKASK